MRIDDETDPVLLVTVDGVEFNEYSSMVISVLLSKRRSVGGVSITETIKVVSHDKNPIKQISSTIISKISP